MAPLILNGGLDRYVWSYSVLVALSPEERVPYMHRVGGWVGPRAGVDALQ